MAGAVVALGGVWARGDVPGGKTEELDVVEGGDFSRKVVLRLFVRQPKTNISDRCREEMLRLSFRFRGQLCYGKRFKDVVIEDR